MARPRSSNLHPTPCLPHPEQVENDLLQVTDLKRVLPGMIWNVTGIISFSHGSWELVPRTQTDLEGADDVIDALSAENLQVRSPPTHLAFDVASTRSPATASQRLASYASPFVGLRVKDSCVCLSPYPPPYR